MTAWLQQLEHRVRLIHDEIAEWRVRAREMNVDPNLACAPFYEILDQIYSEDFPLARARDNSDLLLHIHGRAVEEAPRISFVSGLFNNVKTQVKDLTKAIVGILPDKRVSAQDIDLGLSGFARGSLFIGFNVPLPRERQGHENLLGTEDPLYKATKDALKIINRVSYILETDEPAEAFHQTAVAVDDPKVRDAALISIRRIAPSGRQGVSSIQIIGSSDEQASATLTPETRSKIARMLINPTSSNEVIEIEGVVREIDLDAKRFEIRNVIDHAINDIRCVYNESIVTRPRSLLDARVRVRGRVERRSDNLPRLIALDEVAIVEPAKDHRT